MAVPASAPAPAPVDDEIPTQPLPRVEMPRQQLSTQDMAEPGSANRGALDAQDVGREKVDPAADDTGKELAEGDPDGAQDYRTRVEEAQLPDDVRKAALCEVGKLERTSAQSPECGDIRIWLDTILELPWRTKITDSIDIQGSREVEATLRRLIEPAVADAEDGDAAEVEAVVADAEDGDAAEVEAVVADAEDGDAAEVEAVVADAEDGDAAEVEAVVADAEDGDAAEVEAVVDVEEGDAAEVEAVVVDVDKADTAPGGPLHDDTVKMPAVPAVLSGGRHQRLQLPEQQVIGPEPVQTPAKKTRFVYLALAATLLAVLLIGALLFGVSRDGGVRAQSIPTVTATATATASKPTSEPSDKSTATGGKVPTIQLEDLADSARPFQTVRIKGTYRGGPDTFVQVQRWEGGEWLASPIPAKTDESGQFTTFVELGPPGRYRLRVVDPDSGVTSETFVLVITG